MLKTLVTTALLLVAAPWPAAALQQCTRPLIGSGPELGAPVCTEVTSDRGTTIAVTEVPAAEQLALHRALHAPPLTPEERAQGRARAAQRQVDAAANTLHRLAEDAQQRAETARQEHEAWRAQHGYVGQDGLWHPFTPRDAHRYYDRRGTVVGPKRGGVFVKVR